MTSRGIRNNNPFNLDFDPETKWQGLKGLEPPPLDGSRARFCAFLTPVYGIRAGCKTLLTYQNHDGCKTPREVISRWAPPKENNTAAYIAAVCAALKAAGFTDNPDAVIDVDSAAVMNVYVRAIILHEEGSQPYTDAQISEGIRMAGVADAKPPPLHKQPAFVAHAGSCIALAGSACVAAVKGAVQDPATAAHQLKGVADSLGDYASVPMFSHIVTALLTVAGGLAVAGLASQVLKQKVA